MCAAAFIRHRETIAADADGLALVGDANAARAADDDAAFIAAEGAEPGEIAIPLEPGSGERIVP